MKQLVLIAFAAILTNGAFAQTANAVFFSEFGEKFIVYINGAQQNDTYAANVKAEGLNQDFAKVRIDFEDDMHPDFQGNAGFEMGKESTYIIKKNRKGKYVLRFQGIADIPQTAQVAEEVPAQRRSTETVVEPAQPASTTQTTTTTTTTTTKGGTERVGTTMDVNGERVGVQVEGGSDKAGVTMEVPGGKVTLSVDAPGFETESETTVTQSTTTTTTTSSSGTMPQGEVTRTREPAIPGYNGRIGCDWPVDDGGFKDMKGSIASKTFSDTKMTIAKQATRSKCLTAKQVKEIMTLFTYEDDKLDYAKFAYDYCYDQDNYYMVNDAFEFEMTIDELNEYLESK